MNVRELNREQLRELKEQYIVDWYASQDKTPSWNELANADHIVADYCIYDHYDGIDFVPDDFICSSN